MFCFFLNLLVVVVWGVPSSLLRSVSVSIQNSIYLDPIKKQKQIYF